MTDIQHMTPRVSVVLSLGLLLAGCDKLPWASKDEESVATASPGMTTAQSVVVPGRPVVSDFDVVAMVNGVPISKADSRLRLSEIRMEKARAVLARRAPSDAEKPFTQQELDQLLLSEEELDNLVQFLIEAEVLSQDAVKRGLERDPDIQQLWEYQRRTFFLTQWLLNRRKQLEDTLTEPLLAEVFEKYKEGFREPERRQVRQIEVATEEEAKEVLARLYGGSITFQDLVREKSLDAATKSQDGLLKRWVIRAVEARGRYPTEQEAEAAGIMTLDAASEGAVFGIDRVKGVSNYVKGMDNRYHVFQLVEKKEEQQRTLAEPEVRARLKEHWLSQQIQADVKTLISAGEASGQITKPSDVRERLQDVQRAIVAEIKQP